MSVRTTQRFSRGRLKWSARFHVSLKPEPVGRGRGRPWEAASGQRGTPRAQTRDVRSAGRDTWNLTGEALGGPRKRSWRRCSRARSRSGRRSAIRGAHSGARVGRNVANSNARRSQINFAKIRPLIHVE